MARQIWWLQIVRMAIGCAAICAGIRLMMFSMASALLHHQMRQLVVTVPGGILIAIAGIVFAMYERRVAAAMMRQGLILKANGFRCPRLVAIKCSQIRGARYITATLISLMRVSGSVNLINPLATGVQPTFGGSVIELGPYTIGVTGNWKQGHSSHVAQLICDAATDPAIRKIPVSLLHRQLR